MRHRRNLHLCLAAVGATAGLALLPTSQASARSSIRVGLGDRSTEMFDAPRFKQLKIKRTRYFVASDVMQDADVRGQRSAASRAEL